MRSRTEITNKLYARKTMLNTYRMYTSTPESTLDILQGQINTLIWVLGNKPEPTNMEEEIKIGGSQ